MEKFTFPVTVSNSFFFFFANAALITHIVRMFVVFEKKASVIFLGFYFGIAVSKAF